MDHTGSTPLHWACAKSQQHAIRLLVERGANINAQNKRGVTPLHSLILNRIEPLAFWLIRKGTLFIYPKNYYSFYYYSLCRVVSCALTTACRCARVLSPVCRVVCFDDGRRPKLFFDLYRPHATIGADIMLTDNEGQTPADLALPWTQQEMKEIFAEVKAGKVVRTSPPPAAYNQRCAIAHRNRTHSCWAVRACVLCRCPRRQKRTIRRRVSSPRRSDPRRFPSSPSLSASSSGYSLTRPSTPVPCSLVISPLRVCRVAR
jgi:hypothetical protein